MTGRYRYLLALAFVGLFFLVPAADPVELAYLDARTTLMGARNDGGLFAEHVAALEKKGATDIRMPPLAVTLALPSPQRAEGESPAAAIQRHEEAKAAWLAKYERSIREWTRKKGRPPLDEALAPMQLQVHVGDKGHRIAFQSAEIQHRHEKLSGQRQATNYYPDQYSLAPAFLAIVIAILTGWVIPALLLGCAAGAVLYMWQTGGAALDWAQNAGQHLFVDTIFRDVLQDTFSLEIMGFVLLLFMTVGIMARSGGILGMVNLVQRFARGPVSSQLCTYIIGLLIFFDDYTNCVITGTTMRPLTDRVGISREKLAYIVDATAAPIAGISIFSTWVAYEVSMFAPQLPEVTNNQGVPFTQNDGFGVFIASLPFRFYCIFTLVMVLMTILMRREFGPMLRAERRAHHEQLPLEADAKPMVSQSFEDLEPDEDTPHRARNALIPIGMLIAVTITLIFTIGWREAMAAGEAAPEALLDKVKLCLAYTASQKGLFYGSLVALVTAVALCLIQRLLQPMEILTAALRSARALGFAVVILILAWSIGNICGDVGTAHFLTAAFGNAFSPWLLPALLFLISSLVAFSTGTSYGTMAILLPNVVVLSHTMGIEAGIGGVMMMLITIGAVLEGSIFGDHCSPISDTTVLSSVATGCDHLHHVRTQAPYAVFIMLVSLVCGYIPIALIGSSWMVLPIYLVGFMAILAGLRFWGGRPEHRL